MYSKEELNKEIAFAKREGYNEKPPVNLSNFILDTDELTTDKDYQASATGNYDLQKWTDKITGEKFMGIKSEVVLHDDSNNKKTKVIFGDFESGTSLKLTVKIATDKENKPIMSKRNPNLPYRNFVAERVSSKVAENIS